jgi:hypothetical protein
MACGSVWECPVCAENIQRRRADELCGVVKRHRDAGGDTYLLTLTLPHDEGDELKPLRQHVAKSWQRVIAGRTWQNFAKRLGIAAYVRALEPTNGPNGWHPHLHVLLFSSSEWNAAQLDDARRWFYDRWCRYITQRNPITGKVYRKPSARHGLTIVRSRDETYVTKMGLSHELVSETTKRGRDGHRTPLQILASIDRGGPTLESDLTLWDEYSRALRGARQLTWSRGLRAKYALGEEVPDEQLALDPDLGNGEAMIVYEFTAPEWDRILRCRPELRVALLYVPILKPPDEWVDWIGVLIERYEGKRDVPFLVKFAGDVERRGLWEPAAA